MLRKLSYKVVAALAVAALTLAATASPAFAASRTGAMSASSGGGRTDASKFTRDRQDIESIREKSFPKLGGKYQVIGPSTPTYNCIAWSLDVTTRWVWPGTSMGSFDDLDAQYGFKRMSKLDYSLQPGVEKIVLYGKYVNGKFEATHQARQMSDGTWTSKLGKMALIKHTRPEDVAGGDYGQPVAVYYRKKA